MESCQTIEKLMDKKKKKKKKRKRKKKKKRRKIRRKRHNNNNNNNNNNTKTNKKKSAILTVYAQCIENTALLSRSYIRILVIVEYSTEKVVLQESNVTQQ